MQGRNTAAKILDEYDLATELSAIKQFLQHRGVPAKADDNLLVLTWNIEMLGAKKRSPEDYRLIAEFIRPFDVAAIQEVKSNLEGLRAVLQNLPGYYRTIFTDTAGNAERLAFVYDSRRVRAREQIAELAIPEAQMHDYDLPEKNRKFNGFDRNPFLVSFERRGYRLTLANVHIYFGKESGVEYLKRLVEVHALAKWASREVRRKYAFDRNVVLIGDMNVERMDEADPVFQSLIAFGYKPTDWTTKVGTSLDDTKHFDQVAIYPKRTLAPKVAGVLNLDKHLFREIWSRHNLDPNSASDLKSWREYCEKHISDHRPLWASFGV